jgi:hypothetical protein
MNREPAEYLDAFALAEYGPGDGKTAFSRYFIFSFTVINQ